MAPPEDAAAQDTSYVEMRQDHTDATLIGKHCQYEYCNQLDFLPFFCQSCKKTFCLDHRSETGHQCANAGAWAERKRLAQLAQPSIGAGKTLRDRVPDGKKPCARPECQTTVGTSLAPGVHCQTCNRDYCLKHRLQEDHDCKNLVPIGARPSAAAAQYDLVGKKTKSAFDKLRAWGSAKKEQANRALPKPKPSTAAARVVAVNKLKTPATGDDALPVVKRLYL
jgi:predicted nucleic acid binding AN1-type Zn finger protein